MERRGCILTLCFLLHALTHISHILHSNCKHALRMRYVKLVCALYTILSCSHMPLLSLSLFYARPPFHTQPMTTFVTCVNCGNRWKFWYVGV